MIRHSLTLALSTFACCFMVTACKQVPGKPGPVIEASRPEQITDFATLYQENCASCHGERGRGGAAISLANPAYIATAGVDNIARITAQGVPGTLMPGFAKPSGGYLTDAQIATLAQGIASSWGKPDAFTRVALLPYAASAPANASHGEAAYTTFCAGCHGGDTPPHAGGGTPRSNSVLDPTYLALVSDQDLRSTIIAGHQEQGIDWRSLLSGPNARPLTAEEATDIVAWLATHRVASPGQPYPQHQ